jgi:hypothetical protein
MPAADYVTVKVLVEATANRVEKKTPTDYLVPKSSLIEAVGAKLDLDAGVTDTNYGALVADGV